MSPARAILFILCVPVACDVIACGLDESGLLPDDASTDLGPKADAGVDVDYDVSLHCDDGATLDSSCLGHPVPTGWVPVGYRENVGGCGSKSNEFNELPFVTDAQAPPGSCVCGCSASGSWSCVAELLTGDNVGGCGPPGAVTYVDASACWTQGSRHFEGTVTLTGSPTCGAGTLLDAGATSTPVSVCVPKTCGSDYCALVAQGYEGCIWNPGAVDAGCPPDFTTAVHVVGVSASAQCNCPSCALGNADASCAGGTLTADPNAGCTGTPVASSGMDGVCRAINPYNSLSYEAGPTPVPECVPTSGATGTASLDSPVTICCSK